MTWRFTLNHGAICKEKNARYRSHLIANGKRAFKIHLYTSLTHTHTEVVMPFDFCVTQWFFPIRCRNFYIRHVCVVNVSSNLLKWIIFFLFRLPRVTNCHSWHMNIVWNILFFPTIASRHKAALTFWTFFRFFSANCVPVPSVFFCISDMMPAIIVSHVF